MDDLAIKVENVSKDFRLPHEKATTVKSLFTGALRGGSNRTYERQHALKDISFEVKQGEFFGVVGRNGSGKSTLLKLLAGIYQPTKGNLSVTGRLVPFIELGVGFNPELTGKENVFLNGALLGFSHKEIEAMYKSIVEFAELENFMDQKLKNYSSGMQVRLAFSMAIRAEADILLVDEVLAVGDADFQRKCFDYFKSLKRNKKTVVFVSHDMEAVKEYCDRALLIDKSEIVAIGEPRKIAKLYSRMFMQEGSTEEGGAYADDKRWGSGQIVFEQVKVHPSKLIDQEYLVIETVAKAKDVAEEVVFGFSISNAAGQLLFGTNSLIKSHPPSDMKKGDNCKVTWKMPNIFNDGEHFINVAIVKGGTIEAYDWWDEAARFTVLKEEHNPYPVNPPIEVSIK